MDYPYKNLIAIFIVFSSTNHFKMHELPFLTHKKSVLVIG